jgi:DNA-binding LytR/AlgR family response regulator
MVLIVEDNVIEAIQLCQMLERIGLDEVLTVDEIKAAKEVILEKSPEIVFIDIFLQGDESGIELIDWCFDRQQPCVVITKSSSREVFERANQSGFVMYMVKPVQELSLLSAIQMLLKSRPDSINTEKSIFIPGRKNNKVRIALSDVLWVESAGNYIHVKTKTEQFTFKGALWRFMQKLDERFIQIQKRFIVNKTMIVSFGAQQVLLEDGTTIPIGRVYWPSVLELKHTGLDIPHTNPLGDQ